VPASLAEAAGLLAESKVAVDAFGQTVVDHYLNAARIELDEYAAVVTDWERLRGFERL
jgi:glutamine synthetase